MSEVLRYWESASLFFLVLANLTTSQYSVTFLKGNIYQKGRRISKMLTNVSRLTKKGQLTLPKKIRDKLNSDAVVFEIVDDKVILRPVRSVAGALRKYAKGLIPFGKARERAWEEVAHERSRKRIDRR